VSISIHDQMPDHPQISGLSDPAFRLLVESWCWCSRSGRGDRVTIEAWLTLPGTSRARGELVRAGLVQVDDHEVVFSPSFTGRRKRFGVRVQISESVRSAVYERDGHACVVCGTSESLTLDHIFPWSQGGCDDPGNLQTMCQSCNSRKGARLS